MPDSVRFHLDESVDPAIAAGLERCHIDVTTSQGEGLLSRSDQEQLRFAVEHGRILVTHDAGFLRLARKHPAHCGIAYCKMNMRSVGEMIRRLIVIHDTRTIEDMRDRIEFL
jgi:predicted nuclease of predicted toxin-antitoxin system